MIHQSCPLAHTLIIEGNGKQRTVLLRQHRTAAEIYHLLGRFRTSHPVVVVDRNGVAHVTL